MSKVLIVDDSPSQLVGMKRTVEKLGHQVVTAEDVPLAIRQSVISASTGRPGPSVLDIGFQVLVGSTTCAAEKLELHEPPGT